MGDVLLIIRASAARYPPTVNQANLLVRTGYEVTILETSPTTRPERADLDPQVERIVLGTTEPFGSVNRLTHRVRARLAFGVSVQAEIRRRMPKVLIAYDSDAIAAAARPSGRVPLRISHLHELPLLPSGTGLARWRSHVLRNALASSDVVILPDPFRAAIYMAHNRPSREPMVAYNCLMATTRPVEPYEGRPEVVVYQGVLSASRGLECILDSMRYWPPTTKLSLRGLGSDKGTEELSQSIRQRGLVGRVTVTRAESHSCDDALKNASGARVGLALYQDSMVLNERFSAFASNKIFEYLAAGTPVIAPDRFGYRELVENLGLGLCVEPGNPRAVGEAVTTLVSDRRQGRIASKAAAESSRRYFNYEAQFAAVAERISEALRA